MQIHTSTPPASIGKCGNAVPACPRHRRTPPQVLGSPGRRALAARLQAAFQSTKRHGPRRVGEVLRGLGLWNPGREVRLP
jgi:hypothetical protein